MKKIVVLSIFMAFMLLFGISGSVFAAGIEPGGDPPADCTCLSICGEPEGIAKPWPILLGTFTAAYEPGTIVIENNTETVFHLFLRNWRQTLLYPGSTASSQTTKICDEPFNEDFMKEAIYQGFVLCNQELKDLIFAEFDLEGTPLIKNLVITQKGGCGNTDDSDDIVRGIISISVVPNFPVCSDETCYGDDE